MNWLWRFRFVLASALAVGCAAPLLAGQAAVNCCAMPDCQHHDGDDTHVHVHAPADSGVATGGAVAKPVEEPVEGERVYVSPDMRLGFLRGTPESVPGMGEEYLAVGRGAVMGVDVKVSPAVSLCYKFGMLVAGPGGNEAVAGGDADSSELRGANMYAGVGVTFRFGRGGKAKAARGDDDTNPVAD